MFSKNNRISERQAFRLLTYDLLGLSTLLVPTALAKTAGRDGIFCVALGIFASVVYLWLLQILVKDCVISFPCYVEQCVGKVVGKLVMGGYFLYLLLLAGYTAYLFCDVVLESLLREESFYLVLTVLLLLVLYGLWGGLEGRARVYEILFWFLLIPLFLMLFFALDEIEPDYWSPVFVSKATDVLAGAYEVFLCMAVIFLVLFLGNYVRSRDNFFQIGKRALLVVGGIHALLYLILEGIFGAQALSGMEYPAVTLMSTVKISGGFLKRTDAFIFAVWFFTLYALLASLVFYGGDVLKYLLNRWLKKGSGQKNSQWISFVVVAFSGGLAVSFYLEDAWMEVYEWILWYVATPFVVFIPVLLVLLKLVRGNRAGVQKVGKTLGFFALVCFAAGGMSGCASAELEDRNFPIELAVQPTEDFSQGFLEAHGTGNRVIDYSHLKVIILSKAFAEDDSAMQEFLELMEARSEVPQNAYVVVAEDAEKILAMKDVLGESVGNYLEQTFENVSQVRKQEYPTLGKLYQQTDNRNETLFLPFVREEEEGIAIANYYVFRRGEPFGMVDSPTALLSFFTQNQMDEYQVMLEGGKVVSLFDAHNEIRFSEEGGKKLVIVQINCSGEVVNQISMEESEQAHLRTQIETYMNLVAGQALEQQRVDITDSFCKLGAKREWYFYYQEHMSDYEEDIQIIYEVDIDWVNL